MSAWQKLEAMSQPIPLDDSHGHCLHLASWKIVDGGIVEWSHQAFCCCNWSQRFPTRYRDVAVQAYEAHLP